MISHEKIGEKIGGVTGGDCCGAAGVAIPGMESLLGATGEMAGGDCW